MKSVKMLLLATVILLCTEQLSAQKTHELSLTYSPNANFGLMYKRQLKKESRYLRISSGELTMMGAENMFRINTGLNIGWENRRAINDKLNFVHGLQTSVMFQGQRIFDERNFQVGLGIGYMAGLQYQINNQFYIQLEVAPQLNVLYPINASPIGIFRGNTNAFSLQIAYRFNKK